MSRTRLVAFSLVLALCCSAVLAETAPDRQIDILGTGLGPVIKPSDRQVVVVRSEDPAAPGLAVTIEPGDAAYPGISIARAEGTWDLSACGHVEARIVNTCDRTITVNLRVDNPGDWRTNPWNAEGTSLKAGESRTISVIFGYSYGYKPGYALNPATVSQMLIFTGKVKEPVSFRVEWLRAAGPTGEKPPVRPEAVRVKPVNGYLMGSDLKIDVDKQFEAADGAKVAASGDAANRTATVTCPAGKDSHVVSFHPAMGRWDLTAACEVRVKLQNVGAVAVTPGALVTSDKSNGTDTVFSQEPLDPGAAVEIVVPFAPATPWKGPEGTVTKPNTGGQKGTGTNFASDKADAVRIILRHAGEAAVEIVSIMALATPVQPPDWLGRRPPVEGDWTVTFDETFDGNSIDLNRWNIYTQNYWDKRSHFSKDNVIVGDGVARLRIERKRGHENDDPARPETDYAVGFLDTYGKWTQRFGYFEARMKLPTAPGLWPAFWMMPDRGVDAGPQWKRADTGHGGMEFDIMEHLTRWGPFRYNIALHWDGYQKDHKSIGTSNIYVQADKDGFITAGLLWLPGSATFYCNGKIVAEWKNDRVSVIPSYPILYMVTGGWDNNPLDDAQLPADFVIDYVRVWQRRDLVDYVVEPKEAPKPPAVPAIE